MRRGSLWLRTATLEGARRRAPTLIHGWMMLLAELGPGLGITGMQSTTLPAWLAERGEPATVAGLFAALHELAAEGEAP